MSLLVLSERSVSHSPKMSAKLVVHKFESENNFKSLQITIDDSDNWSSEARYSEWVDGEIHQEHKENDKPSRLIVKIVSGNGYSSIINLESCFKELTGAEKSTHFSKQNLFCYEANDSEDSFRNSSQCNPENYQSSFYNIEETIRRKFSNPENLSPLEYSLERVKENNARIMENIRKLNRTLNYTKKKEILEVVCPKTMRYPCHTCGKCFVYETGLKRHYSMRHSIADNQPRWQVVWTCVECFQVWPRQDLAIKHSSKHMGQSNKSEECVREIKTSSLLQCEFCEKVYTSIPRLLRHSKVHTTVNNYECNACVSTFQSFKAAEQHWLLCPWLKMCYSFSLPKMLLCNICDRKFKTYEQLYNHRYKVGHFITKTYCNKSNFKTPGVLAYQCEVCAQYFPSIGPLLYHRSQDHSVYEAGQMQY